MNTQIFKVSDPEDEALYEVARLLKNDEIAAIPTETVYGLAGNALKGSCVKKIYQAKGRPSDNPLIVHISRLSQWSELVREIPESAMALAEAFWPGPLTIILKKSDIIPDEICGGLDTVAVRMPSDEIARSIIDKCGFPLAAPSANTSGKPSPTSAEYVIEDLKGKISAVVDSGDCSVGIESTVITLATDVPRLLRPGGITPHMLTEILGEIEIDPAVSHELKDGDLVASPGMKYKHYSPEAGIILVRGSFEKYRDFVNSHNSPGVFALCFEGEEAHLQVPCVTYGKKDDPSSQAKHIFDALRLLDKKKAKTAYARFPDDSGVGLAVFNRLVRAAGFNIIEL